MRNRATIRECAGKRREERLSGKHLVFAGGGHAHMQALLGLAGYTAKGHRVTLVSPSPYHYYSGMGPGLLANTYRPEQVRFHIRKMAEDRGATFIEDKVIRIDAPNRALHLESGERLGYDVMSFNVGSEVPLDHLVAAPDDRVFTVKPIHNLVNAQRLILDGMKDRALGLLVIGGGASGVEIAGNLWRLVSRNNGEARITLVARSRLLKRFPEKVGKLARESLSARGIEILEGQAVQSLENGTAILADGNALPCDLTIIATGVRPSPIFRESGIPTAEDGSLLVNDRLQSVAHPEIFGGGDCIGVENLFLEKVGVYAVRQNPILRHNLMAALEGGAMMEFDPGGAYLLILNMGDGTGIYMRTRWIWRGRLAFALKGFLDRRFIKKFQISGESKEAITRVQ